MPRFKVGDRVRVVKILPPEQYENYKDRIGKVYEIASVRGVGGYDQSYNLIVKGGEECWYDEELEPEYTDEVQTQFNKLRKEIEDDPKS